MLMTRSRSKLPATIAIAGALLLAGLALVIYGVVSRHPEALNVTPVAATAPPQRATTAPAPGTPVALSAARFRYIGKWQIVRNMNDGRYAGMSGRSFVPGAQVIITFTGHAVRLYGVDGPGGGVGTLSLDGSVIDSNVSFRAAHKRTHVLVFSSAPLHEGRHQLTLAVNPPSTQARHAYVNIESAAYDP